MVGYKSSFPGLPSPVTAERGKKTKKKNAKPATVLFVYCDESRCDAMRFNTQPAGNGESGSVVFFLQLHLSALFAVEAGHVHVALSMEGKGTNFCW